MLQFHKQQAHFDSVNLRAENHGKDRVLAVDLKLSLTGSNRLLDGIDPNLRESLYRAPDKGDQGDFVDDQAAKENGVEDGLVSVKHPYAGPTTIATKFEGYDVTIRGPLKRSKSIELVDSTVKGLSLQPLDGGSVKIVLSAAVNVDPKEIAVISELFKLGEVRLSLIPPDVQHEAGEESDEEDDDEPANHDDGPPGDILDQQEGAARASASNDDADEEPDLPRAA